MFFRVWHVGITCIFEWLRSIHRSLFYDCRCPLWWVHCCWFVCHIYDEIPSDRRMDFSQDIDFMFSIAVITSTPWQMCHKLTTILSLTLKMIIGLYRSWRASSQLIINCSYISFLFFPSFFSTRSGHSVNVINSFYFKLIYNNKYTSAQRVLSLFHACMHLAMAHGDA